MTIEFETEEYGQCEKEMTMTDFEGTSFIKNKDVGEQLVLDVVKVVDNKKIEQTNRETGSKFSIGLKDRNGEYRRIDIHTPDGIYTVGSWEVYFKLFGNEGLLMKYAESHNKSFKGAKIGITRMMNGNYASMKLVDLAKILGVDVEQAKIHQDDVKNSIKEKRLYKVELLA